MTAMKAQDGYKVTDIGTIPEEWQVMPLGSVTTIVSGGTPNTETAEYWENGVIPWATPTDITSNGKYIYTTARFITRKGLESSAAVLLPTGSVLMTSRATIGACSINKVPMSTNQGFKSLIAGEKLYNEFLYYLMNCKTKTLMKLAGGSTFLEISKVAVEGLLCQIPPLPEQQKIAEILSTVDEHIRETEELIEKTKTLKQGMMQRLLTKGIGHTEFKDTEIGRIPASWEVLELEQAAKIIMGQSPNSGSYNTTGKGLPFYQGKADFGDKYPITRVWCSESIKIAPPDSILISVRAPVGSINLSQVKSCIGRGLAAIVVEDARTRAYLYFYLQFFASKFEKVSQGSTFTAINSGDLYGFLVATPCIAEQEKISSMLSGIDDQIDTYKCKLDTLTRLKSGLMQQLLTGRIRVKV